MRKADSIVCGIYRILHKSSGRIYIGSSVHILKRWDDHRCKLNQGKHENRYLQHAWTKYGQDDFLFEIVELATRDSAHEIERRWMQETCCLDRSKGFNIEHDPDQKVRVPLTQEHRQAVSDALKGRIFTDEHRTKLSMALKGKPKSHHAIEAMRRAVTGKRWSEQRIQKRIGMFPGSKNGNSKLTEDTVILIKQDLIDGYSCQSIARKYNIGSSTISRILNGGNWTHVMPDVDIQAERRQRLNDGKICAFCQKWRPFAEYPKAIKSYCATCWRQYGQRLHAGISKTKPSPSGVLVQGCLPMFDYGES